MLEKKQRIELSLQVEPWLVEATNSSLVQVLPLVGIL